VEADALSSAGAGALSSAEEEAAAAGSSAGAVLLEPQALSIVKHRARAISRAVSLVFMAIFLSWGDSAPTGAGVAWVSRILSFLRLFCKSAEEKETLLFPRECAIMYGIRKQK
jgi:hypothetical protein